LVVPWKSTCRGNWLFLCNNPARWW
jgi:hypothetical protein